MAKSKRPAFKVIKAVGRCSNWLHEGRRVHGLILKVRTAHDPKRFFIRYSELGHPQRLWDTLLDVGCELPVASLERKRLLDALQRNRPKRQYRAVDRLGWHHDQYVLPSGKVLGKGEGLRLLYQPAFTSTDRRPMTAGTVAEWTRHVAKPARHSSTMIFSISLAFAAPLIREHDKTRGGIFHLNSLESGAGKTLCQEVAQSVMRPPEPLPHWDFTATASEELAAEHTDSLMTLDEIARLASTPADQAVKAEAASFRLAGGVARQRSKSYTAETQTWRIFALSSGEHRIGNIASAAGRKRLRGDIVRMIDVPVVRDKEKGVFDRLPIGMTTAAIAHKLVAGIKANHGLVGRAFVKKYLAHHAANRQRLHKLHDMFMSKAEIAASDGNWEYLFASGFALAFAAAMLAHRFGLVGWSEKVILRAIRQIYRDARADAQSEPERVAATLARLKKRLHGKKRLVDIRSGESSLTDRLRKKRSIRYGYIRQHKGRTEYLVRRDALLRWIGPAIRPSLVIDILRNQGALKPDGRNLDTAQVSIKGDAKRARYYRIIAKKL